MHRGDLSHRVEPFCKVLVQEVSFGTLAAVALPEGRDEVAPEHLEGLHEQERSFALELRGRRRIEWVGGRLALRLAAAARGLSLGPILPDASGAPALPDGWTASISHKRTLAAALIGEGPTTVGLDIEELEPARNAIASRILDAVELAAWERLAEEERWPYLVRRFSLKEATYKAIHPHLLRFVSFHEARIPRADPGPVSIFLHLQKGETPPRLEAELREERGHVWAMVRATARP
jgi:phosphopantetheine--protein transferase-like protein